MKSSSESLGGKLGFRIGRCLTGPSPQPFAHIHHDIELNYIFAGSVTYLHGSRVITLPSERLILFWAGIPHRVIQWSDDARMDYITIPLEWFLSWGAKDSRRSEVLSGAMLFDSKVDDEWRHFDAWCVTRWLNEFEQTKDENHECLKIEVSARIRRLLKTGEMNTKQRKNASIGHDKLALALEYISTHFDQSITAEDIAHAVGYHPNYFQSLFRKTCNLTLWDYLTHYRVSQAQRMLLETDWPVTTIAFECGFGSSSSFYRAFEKINAGESPVDFRKRVTAVSK
ncbi:helix-turn-helix domain-containing protein [Rubellicoccus peritrichatus]|uniref:Helix-turn-helix domain-containing protein n=1 Tax=Rubellicoccus peritrichatus TaxID=3080537 RepID=A0AAQ3QS61_9BACT|nr:helix-turn-helix domain-containing protein [Puniceicoccus sp. CR14]WOO40021.1 helix-turn-helix domain-containing protein [Puniceicoccus sp. CR14]